MTWHTSAWHTCLRMCHRSVISTRLVSGSTALAVKALHWRELALVDVQRLKKHELIDCTVNAMDSSELLTEGHPARDIQCMSLKHITGTYVIVVSDDAPPCMIVTVTIMHGSGTDSTSQVPPSMTHRVH